jgi:putative redox protein
MSKKTAIIKRLEGITFSGKTDSGHWVMMDGPENFGGNNAAIRPKELLLLALGGCTGSDVSSILSKKRVPVDKFEINIEAEMADEHPQVYTKIHVEYLFTGNDLKVSDLERAIELSMTKYCAVTAMLQNAVEITHSYKIQ